MKIFGVGLSKTGTRSLAQALRILGYRAVQWPYTKTTLRYIKGRCTTDYKMFEAYDAFTDTPVARSYKGLEKHYPDSKFILTVRDMDSWLISCENFWGKLTLRRFLRMWLRPVIGDQVNKDLYGSAYFQKKKFSAAYQRHVADVLDHFTGREEKLLVLDICGGDGWEKLCRFLDKPLPDKPFPQIS